MSHERIDQGSNRIVLFALSTCPACKKTKRLLKEKGVDHISVDLDTVDIDSRERLLDSMREYNPKETFPTMVIDKGDEVLIGFSEDEILDTLKRRGIIVDKV